MKFSLIMPIAIHADNATRVRMLVECLESIRAQKHRDYEIILKDAYPLEPVVRHQSIKKCLDSMREHVNYICCTDKDWVDGQNQALQSATGDILHIVNGDDLMGDPDTLDFVQDQFKTQDMSKPAWLYGSLGTVLEDGSEGHWGVTPYATLDEILVHNRMGCPGVYWNKAMYDRIGHFEYTHANDYDYWCRCYRVTPPMYTTRLLAVGRRWNQSLSHIHKDVVEQEAIDISAKHSAEYAAGKAPEYVSFWRHE